MENVVLGLLIIQSLTLYELNQAFKQGISMFYSASLGSLQAALKSLLGKGMVIYDERVEKGRNKKVYHITKLGRVAFFEWMLAEVSINKLEVTALAKVFFLGLIEDTGQKKQIVADILDKIRESENQLSQMNEELQRLDIPESYRSILKYQLKTLNYGLHSHAAAGEWFRGLLCEIEDR